MEPLMRHPCLEAGVYITGIIVNVLLVGAIIRFAVQGGC